MSLATNSRAALPPPEGPNNHDDQDDDDDECIVLDDDYLQHAPDEDLRRFPERVWEMVTKEAAMHDGVIQWEAEFSGGQAFGVERDSQVFVDIVQRYFGSDTTRNSFVERLFKYGWTRVRSAK